MLLNKFEPVAITRGRGRNRIHRIGIELEGGWMKLPSGTSLVHDGSVRFVSQEEVTARSLAIQRAQHQAIVEATKKNKGKQLSWETADRLSQEATQAYEDAHPLKTPKHVGELPSMPLSVGSPDRFSADGEPVHWIKWIEKFYPSHVNETCGMHVHMSFASALTYQRLMDGRYPRTVVEEFIKWAQKEKLPSDHPFWNRLNGSNDYCQHKFFGDAQAVATSKGHRRDVAGHRYTVISFQYTRLGTAECRLLPMFDAVDQAIRAIQELLDITNGFLLATGKRESKVELIVPNEDQSFNMSFVEHV